MTILGRLNYLRGREGVREIVCKESPVVLGKVEKVNNHLLRRSGGVESHKHTLHQDEENRDDIILAFKQGVEPPTKSR